MRISSSARRHLAVYGEIVYNGWHLMRDRDTGSVHGRRIIGWHWQDGVPVNDLGDTDVLIGYQDQGGRWND